MNHWTGRKHSEETKEKMRLAHLGKKNHFYGKHHTAESRKKIAIARRGKCLGEKNPTYGGHRLETKQKVSKTRIEKKIAVGIKNPNYRHGKSFAKIRRDTTAQYKSWRQAVFNRDDFTCQFCHQRGGDLEADHIKPVAFFPELIYEIDNGRTLCLSCHRKTFKEIQVYRKIYYANLGAEKGVSDGEQSA